MSRYIPYSLHWDNAPLDISFVFQAEKPAGKHGFLTVQEDKFVFEDGTVARFFGTLFNSGMNFCSHDHARITAKRLAKFGINLVRLHQMDADSACPNIFNFTRGAHENRTTEFDPESLDRLDYLQACLKEEGIYVYVDGINHRIFRSGDGVRNAHLVDQRAGRPFCLFDRTMIDLQKKFNHDLMTHVNPYTKLRWCDDPAVAIFAEAPETTMFQLPTQDKWPINAVEPYRTELEQRFRCWAKDEGIEVGPDRVDMDAKDNKALRRFYVKLEKDYYSEISEALRADGVRIPLMFDSPMFCVDHLTSIAGADYSDNHLYWWAGDQRDFMSNNLSGSLNTLMESIGITRLGKKPHLISEWDAPWPNHYRAESPIFVAAYACLQGSSGMTVHTYRYGSREDEMTTGRLGRDIVIGGSYYRGTFDTYNDPAKFGLFYHAALMMRRGDIQPAKEWVSVKLPHHAEPETIIYPKDITGPRSGLMYQHRVSVRMDGMEPFADREIPWDLPAGHKVDYTDAGEMILTEDPSYETPKQLVSDTGELVRDLEHSIGTVDSPRTQAVYGFIGGHSLELSSLTVKAETDFAVVALSSLSDAPIASSENLLLSTVGRVQNTGYEDELLENGHRRVTSHGTAPVLAEAIEAEIRIKTCHCNQRVVSIDEDGFITGKIPSRYENGELVFEVGKEFARIYYLIQTV